MAVGSEDRGPEIGSLCPHGGIPAWPLCGSGQGSGRVSLLFQPPAKLLSFTRCPTSHPALHWTWAAGQNQLLPASRVPSGRVQWPGGDGQAVSGARSSSVPRSQREQQLALGHQWAVHLSHQGCVVRAYFGSLNNWVEAWIPWCSASRWLQA